MVGLNYPPDLLRVLLFREKGGFFLRAGLICDLNGLQRESAQNPSTAAGTMNFLSSRDPADEQRGYASVLVQRARHNRSTARVLALAGVQERHVEPRKR